MTLLLHLGRGAINVAAAGFAAVALHATASAAVAHPAPAPAAGTVQPGAVPAATALPKVWAGHLVALGNRKVPVLGNLETRTDTFVIATLYPTDTGYRMVQQACGIRFAPVNDVVIEMDVRALPETVTHFERAGEGPLRVSSAVSWGEEDRDEDGHPGVTVDVRASICDGSLYVASSSDTTGTARVGPRFVGGFAQTTMNQRILGAEGVCLSAVASDSREELVGPFAYVPTSDDATCASLLRASWPVDAMPNE